jgi:DNA-binding transcriptional ArsR family regulator
MRSTFERLRQLRDFERRNLGFLKTCEDHDLVYEIGWHQAQGKPLTVKQIFLLGLGSVPTVQRRLARLRRLGIITQQRCEHDRRSVEVSLAPKVLKGFAQYNELLSRP